MRHTRHGTDLYRDEHGITLVEFALVAPVLVLAIIGMFDLGHQLYATSVMQGSLQQAARESTLEKGFSQTEEIDQRLRDSVDTILPLATLKVTRRNFATFSDVTTPEEFTDNNDDGTCNDNEPFEDLNGNGNWDQDRGRDGIGGARDAVVFTATATYDRMFPLAGLIDVDEEVTIRAVTVLRNQPYNEQGRREPTVENCA